MRMKKQKSKKRGNKLSLREQYKLSWEWIKKCKSYIWVIVGIFVAFALVGFFVPASSQLSEMIMNFIKELVAKTQGMSRGELIGFIFLNNLQSCFIGLIFGVAVGVFPILVAIANGYLLGFVGAMSVNVVGWSSLLSLFPHGIFELPAVFIALGMGMKFGTFWFRKEKGKSFQEFFWNSLRVFIFVILPLLIIAAIIEGCLMIALN